MSFLCEVKSFRNGKKFKYPNCKPLPPTDLLSFRATNPFSIFIFRIDTEEGDQQRSSISDGDKDLYFYEIDGLPAQPTQIEDIFEPHVHTRVSFSTEPMQVWLVIFCAARESLKQIIKKIY